MGFSGPSMGQMPQLRQILRGTAVEVGKEASLREHSLKGGNPSSLPCCGQLPLSTFSPGARDTLRTFKIDYYIQYRASAVGVALLCVKL